MNFHKKKKMLMKLTFTINFANIIILRRSMFIIFIVSVYNGWFVCINAEWWKQQSHCQRIGLLKHHINWSHVLLSFNRTDVAFVMFRSSLKLIQTVGELGIRILCFSCDNARTIRASLISSAYRLTEVVQFFERKN